MRSMRHLTACIMTPILSAGLCVITEGCRSSYEPYNLQGGYTEQKLDEHSYFIQVRGNSYTSLATVKSMAFRRAAELCHDKVEVTEVQEQTNALKDYNNEVCAFDWEASCAEAVSESSEFLRPSVTLRATCMPG